MKGEYYQQYVSDYFTENYKELLGIAKKNVSNTEFLAEELLSECYQFCIDNESKIKGLKDIEGKDRKLTRYCAEWMYASVRLFSANGGNSNFRGKFAPTKCVGEPSDNHSGSISITDFDEPENWFNENFNKDQINRIQTLEYIVANDLDEIEKKLYKLYFIEGKKIADLKRLIPEVSEFSFKKLLSDLKEKIKTKAQEYGC